MYANLVTIAMTIAGQVWTLNINVCAGAALTSLFNTINGLLAKFITIADSKVHGANMGPTWVLSAPDGPHIGPMNLAIRDAVAHTGSEDWCFHQAFLYSTDIFLHTIIKHCSVNYAIRTELDYAADIMNLLMDKQY